MQKISTKKLLYLAGGAILLVVIVYSISINLKKSDQSDSVSFPTSSPATNTTTGAVKKTPAKAPLSATKAYLDAIKIYKTTGYYFQFVDCHGAPGTLTLKAGKKFMLDNRDGVARKIAITGGQSFNIGAYGFAVATAPSKIGIHYITCNGGGAASITVQK
jgi:hypothetical protein